MMMLGKNGRKNVLLQWTDLALDDLNKINEYLCQKSSEAVSAEVILKIIDSSELILSHPLFRLNYNLNLSK